MELHRQEGSWGENVNRYPGEEVGSLPDKEEAVETGPLSVRLVGPVRTGGGLTTKAIIRRANKWAPQY